MYLHTGETVYRGWVSHARDALTISIGIWCSGQVRIYLIQDYTWCGRPGLYVEESLRVQYMIQGYIRMVYAWCTHGVRMVYAWWCWQASLKRSIQARAMYSGSAPMGMDNLRRSVWFSTIYTSCKHANVCMGQFEGYKWCTKNKLRSSMRSRDICGVSMPMCTGPFELDLCMIQLGLCTCGVSILMWSEGLTWFRAIHSCCKHADVYKTVRKAPYHSRIYTCKWCKHASVFE